MPDKKQLSLTIQPSFAGGNEYVLLSAKKEIKKLRYTKPNFKTAEIEWNDQAYIIHKTGFLDSDIYVKKKFTKKPGFEIEYNWRLNMSPFEINSRQFYLLPRDFEGKYFAWFENKSSLIMEYRIMPDNTVAIRKGNAIEEDDFLLLLLSS